MIPHFDNDYNTPAPDITGNQYKYIRDLDKVWNSDTIKAQKEKFGPKNTLMLDSNEIRVYNWTENSLITDRFEREDVWAID